MKGECSVKSHAEILMLTQNDKAKPFTQIRSSRLAPTLWKWKAADTVIASQSFNFHFRRYTTI